MLYAEPMVKIQLLVLEKYVEDVVDMLSAKGVLHLSDLRKKLSLYKGEVRPKEEFYALRRANEILKDVKNTFDLLAMDEESVIVDSCEVFERLPPKQMIDHLAERVTKIKKETEKIISNINSLKEESERLSKLKRVYEALLSFKITAYEIRSTSMLAVFFGTAPSRLLPELEKKLSKDTYNNILLLKGKEFAERQVVLISSLSPFKGIVQKNLSLFDFQELKPVDEFDADPNKVLPEIEKKLKEDEKRLMELETSLESIAREKGKELCVLKEAVEIERIKAEGREKFGRTEKTLMIEGWVPEENLDDLKKSIEEITYGTVTMIALKGNGFSKHKNHSQKEEKSVSSSNNPGKHGHDEGENDPPPSNFKFPSMIQPFQGIVNAYGVPSHREINPGIFVALSFPIFFGIMFPDVGHGLILLLVGLWALHVRKTKKIKGDIGKMIFNGAEAIILCGIFSIFFGFFFGEIFGYHLTEKIPSTKKHFPLMRYMLSEKMFHLVEHDETQFNKFKIKLAIVIGVIHILIGLVLNVYNKIKQGEFAEVVGSISWLVFYASTFGVLGVLILWSLVDLEGYWELFDKDHEGAINTFMNILTGTPLFYVAILSLLGMFFGVGIAEILLYRDAAMAKIALGHSAIEAVEGTLSSIGNTASYIRLFALNLAHITLMAVFIEMAGEGITPVSVPILLIGNILVIVLETLVSLLHSLRLQWVEFFSKLGLNFDGYKYEPFTIKREFTAIK